MTFADTHFMGDTSFREAQFGAAVWFGGAQFYGNTSFDTGKFDADARFDGARFSGAALFDNTRLNGYTSFDNAQFGRPGNQAQKTASGSGSVGFINAQFTGHVSFDGTQMTGDALFIGARFENATLLGPIGARSINFDSVVFTGRLEVLAAASDVICTSTTWKDGVTLRLRYAEVDLAQATFSGSHPHRQKRASSPGSWQSMALPIGLCC